MIERAAQRGNRHGDGGREREGKRAGQSGIEIQKEKQKERDRKTDRDREEGEHRCAKKLACAGKGKRRESENPPNVGVAVGWRCWDTFVLGVHVCLSRRDTKSAARLSGHA